MLPLSRNMTYGAASPIKSADVNDLQDMIVGAKHGSVVFPLPAAAWQPLNGGTGLLGNGEWTFGAVTTLVANLPRCPTGTKVTQIVWGYNRGGGGNVTRKMLKRNITTGAAVASAFADPAADNTGAAWETQTDTPNYVFEANVGVWLQVNCDNAANVFGGALVTIELP